MIVKTEFLCILKWHGRIMCIRKWHGRIMCIRKWHGRIMCWSRNFFAHFSTQSFHCIFIMISMKKYGEKTKTNVVLWLVSMEMVAIFDFRALTKVHIYL